MLVPAGSSLGSAGALEMCMEVLSELERSTGVSGFVERARVWLPVSPVAHPLFHLSSSSPAALLSQVISVENPEWLTPAIILFSISVEATLCYKNPWICVCVNVCTICSLSCSTEWEFCLLCSAPTGTCGAGVPHVSTDCRGSSPLEHTNIWAQV